MHLEAQTRTFLFTACIDVTIKALAWSPDGVYIAAACNDSTIRIWDISTKTCISPHHTHPGFVNAVAWSPQGKLMASASVDQKVRVWKAFTADAVFTYHEHSGEVKAVAWSPAEPLSPRLV